MRPNSYRYMDILKGHLNGDLSQIFNGEVVYPRQLEVHLPGDRLVPCNFRCSHCQGSLLDQSLGSWEEDALLLLEGLQGVIPFVIYGGAYTEPLLNPFFLDFIKLTKATGSSFGIHTNGSLLFQLEQTERFLTTLCSIATSADDYLSVSLDAGTVDSHCRTKGLKRDWFSEIIKGIETVVEIRGEATKPAIRVCYLLNNHNSSLEEIKKIVELMQELGVDSLRFSIPYDRYGKDFDKVRHYKNQVEVPKHKIFSDRLAPFVSCSSAGRPFVFYIPPICQDVNRMCFSQCIYSYYQITLAADGFVYKCSSVASSSFKPLRLGKITRDRNKFDQMVLSNHDPCFNPTKCFKLGARCNRIALEINSTWKRLPVQ